MSVRRIVGLETEFGVLDPDNPRANPIELSDIVVDSYGRHGSAAGCTEPVRWDYTGEDPLHDARGFRLERAAADPSMLTDDPTRPAPSGGAHLQHIARPSREELALPHATNTVLTNGARLYVDHAHPEYSSPEVTNPREAVLWDRAGEAIAREAMQILRDGGRNVVLYKNNIDGKGAAYGSHENYLVSREVEFSEIVRYVTPFFVTRPILCGTGRVGLGPSSEAPGFQISQRADYVENDVGLETTFNRPIINTRDEPHAWSDQYRRFHVIGGDANQFDASILLKVGTTALVLWMLEQDEVPLGLETALIDQPVPATWIVSRDLTLQQKLEMFSGPDRTALDIQQQYLDVVGELVETHGGPDWDTREVLDLWQNTLDKLRHNLWDAAPEVEWVAKYQLLEGMRQRSGLSWDSDKLRAIDLQWHDLRAERSIVNKLAQAGRVTRFFTDAEVAWAVTNPPAGTRAYLRGELIRRYGKQVISASWTSGVVDAGGEELVRIPLLDPLGGTREKVGEALDASPTPADFIAKLTAGTAEKQ